MGLLQEAESLVLGVSATARLRLRFLLERAKLHRQIALVQRNGSTELAKRTFDASKHDLDTVESLSRKLKLPLWESIAQIQLQKLQNVRNSA